jgi:hypothetical protein
MNRITQIGLVLALLVGLLACGPVWESESSPVEVDLNSVWGTSDGDVFAVGAGGTVLQRKGGKWHQLNSGTTDDLYGIWGAGGDHMLVVGDNCAALEYTGPVESEEELEDSVPEFRQLPVETCGNFYDVDGADSSSAMVVGEWVMQRYDGTGLRDMNRCGERMLGVNYSASGVAHAVGESGDFCTQEHGSWNKREIFFCPGGELVNGDCPTDRMSPVIWDVWVGEEGLGAAVGTYGGFWAYPFPEGYFWTPLETELDSEFRAVHGWVDPEALEDATTVYAVGNSGTMVRMKGIDVRFEVVGTNEDLNGVWVSPDGKDIYAVGAKGTIVHLRE